MMDQGEFNIHYCLLQPNLLLVDVFDDWRIMCDDGPRNSTSMFCSIGESLVSPPQERSKE